jgi:hypothetical protein
MTQHADAGTLPEEVDDEIDLSDDADEGDDEQYEIPDDLEQPPAADPANGNAAPSQDGSPATPKADHPSDPTRYADGTFKPGQGPAAPSGATASTPAGEPAAAGGPAVPVYTFKAAGAEYEIPGSRVTPEGVFIPREALREVERNLSFGVHHRQNFQRLMADKYAEGVRAANDTHPDVVRAQTMVAELNALLDEGPDAVADYLDALADKRAEMAQKATAERERRMRETYGKPPEEVVGPGIVESEEERVEREQEEAREAFTMAQAALPVEIDAIATAHFGALTAADRTVLAERLGRRVADFFYISTAKDDDGFAPGDIVCRSDLLQAEMEFEARFFTRTAETANAAAQAIAANAARGFTPAALPSVPRPVNGEVPGAAKRKVKASDFKTKADLDALMATDLDEIEFEE